MSNTNTTIINGGSITAGSITANTLSVDTITDWKRKHLAELVHCGALRCTARFPHSVALDLGDIMVQGNRVSASVFLAERIMEALDETVTGSRSLWFTADGEPMMSFEDEGDAVMFRCRI